MKYRRRVKFTKHALRVSWHLHKSKGGYAGQDVSVSKAVWTKLRSRWARQQLRWIRRGTLALVARGEMTKPEREAILKDHVRFLKGR